MPIYQSFLVHASDERDIQGGLRILPLGWSHAR